MTPTTAAAISAVAVDKAGVGSAVLNSAAAGRRLARYRRDGLDRHRRRLLVAQPGDDPRRGVLYGFHDALRARRSCRPRRGDRRGRRDPQGRAPRAAAEPQVVPRDRGASSVGTKPGCRRRRGRQAVLGPLAAAFSRSSYRGATTAEIARAPGSASLSSTGTSDRSATSSSPVRRGLADVPRPGGAAPMPRARRRASARSPTPTTTKRRRSALSTSGSRR